MQFRVPRSPGSLSYHAGLLLTCCLLTSSSGLAQDSPVRIVDFDRDVRPILELKCIHCHGAEDAKNGFRVDDEESMLAYLEPEDIESSSLWTDYLHTDDPDMLMPPASSDGQPAGLTGVELATIKLWIEEGAHWNWNTVEIAVDPELELSATAPLAARIWAFQGLFHPASVHFPVALLTISGLFVFLSFFSRSTFEPAAFHCLWIGALGAVVSCLMGWSYAVHEGYGQVASLSLNSAIDRHRWLGILVAVVSVAMIPLASSACGKGGIGKRLLWFFSAMLVAGGISIVGYQGGELTYGEDHYQKEFERLFPEAFAKPSASEQPEESGGEVDVESLDEESGEEASGKTEESAEEQPGTTSETVTEIPPAVSPFPTDIQPPNEQLEPTDPIEPTDPADAQPEATDGGEPTPSPPETAAETVPDTTVDPSPASAPETTAVDPPSEPAETTQQPKPEEQPTSEPASDPTGGESEPATPAAGNFDNEQPPRPPMVVNPPQPFGG